MDHVLSYINEEACDWDEIYQKRNTLDGTFDNVYLMANLRGVHMLQFLFTRAQITAACEKEFADVIKPNLTEEKFTSLDINRLHMWCNIGKHCDVSFAGHDLKRYHQVLSKFNKTQLLSWNAILKFYPDLHAWGETNFGRNSVMGEKVAFTVEDARNFEALVRSHNLQYKIHELTPIFENRLWNERIEHYYHETADTRWRVSKCAECKTECWNAHMQCFSRTENTSGLKCGRLHCLDCVVKVLKENQAQKRPLFSCGKKCNCFLTLSQVETKKPYAYFSDKLDMTEEALCTNIAETFEACVLAPYRLLPEQIMAKQNDQTHGKTNRVLSQLCAGAHMDTLTDEANEEVSKLMTKVANLLKMGRLRDAMKLLDSATKTVVSATTAKNDEQMLACVKDLIEPIRSVLRNRPDSTDELPDLFGISMLEIANSSLQRAKDAAQTAFSIAKQCAICTTVVSQRGENEDLMTLHDELSDKEVATWRQRINAPCHACKDCFGNYLNFKQSLGKPMLRCPGMNCRCFLDRKKIKAAMPNAFAEYKTAMMRFSLKRVENYRTCPNADCAHGIVLDACCNVDQVTCTACDTSFCPNCNDEPHEGMTCEEFQRKRHAERWGEAKDYMKNETKQCPYCLVWIEKNGGCNHMTCHHCRGEFCWLCFGEWSSHISCTEKKEVIRRPFNELFPNWQEKNKSLKARFHVGKYVTVAPHTDEYVGRVISTHDHGIYHVEAVQIPGVDSRIKKMLVVEESLVRGYNKLIPATANAEEFEEETYSSFLAGFDVDETAEKSKEAEHISVELTTSAVELTTKDASDSESGDSTIDDGDLLELRFMRGFFDSDDEDSEHGDLLAKLDDMDNIVYYENSHKLMQGNVGLKTLRERKKLRAAREKIREGVQDVSIYDSDDEESEIYPAWLLFMNANDEVESESESEDETDSVCATLMFGEDDSSSVDLGFESDDEEESS